MNITRVTLTKAAEETTENAFYMLEFSVVNGKLAQVQATIQENEVDSLGNHPGIGAIYVEQETVSCYLPASRPLSPYFVDFDNFLKAIRESVPEEVKE